ncbi:MAG: NAD(P)H-binding protein [Proteobacteria bacterium]|nr:NAD(P)H-binding protein [Pseudomonadota bacterium]
MLRILIAGATGAIGKRLMPLLIEDGHAVTGMTRVAGKAAALEALGIAPIVVDVFQPQALRKAVIGAHPQIVIHQLTDLPQTLQGPLDAATSARNARIRIEGTANLLRAARAAGARRFIAQSIAFIYAADRTPHLETDALASGDDDAPGAITARGIRALEHATLNTPGIDGIVLRYGRLYGSGTWFEAPYGRGSLHVDAAAHAARLAVTRGMSGVYNIAEDDGEVAIDKARADLGFDPGFRGA